jgi:small GTP-binding protein
MPLSFDLNGFRTRQEHISVQLETLARVARELNIESLVAELFKTQREMMEDTFRFVVVGEFNRGKSTVINTLLRDRILPSALEPTTTVLTKVKEGSTTSFKLFYRDERIDQEITFEQFREIVAPPEPNRNNRDQCQRYEERLIELRNLSMVEITCTAPICQQGVEIIDTPGTNDLDPLREQITYDVIPQADAIIFLLSAMNALTQSEALFLINRVLKADIDRIFFLLNFADTLQPSDLETVRQKCLSDLSAIIKQPRLFPISAKKALSSRLLSTNSSLPLSDDGGFSKLESALALFLQSDRADAKLSRPIRRGIRLCDELLTGPLMFSRASIGLEIPEIERRIEELTPRLQQLQHRRDSVISSLQLRLNNKKCEMRDIYQKGLYGVAEVALAAVDTYTGPLQAEDIGRYIEGRVAPPQSNLQSSFKVSAAEAFADEFRKSQQDLEGIQAKISTLFHSTFDAPWTPLQLPTSTAVPGNRGGILQAGGAGVGLLFLPFFAPLALLVGWLGGIFASGFFESSARQNELGKIRLSVDKRYRGIIPNAVQQFEDAWGKSAQDALKELDDSFERRCFEVTNALQNALEKLKNATHSAKEMKEHLDSVERCLFDVKRNLMNEGLSE